MTKVVKMLRFAKLVFSYLMIFGASNAAYADMEVINNFSKVGRIGLGYSFVGETTVLDQSLMLSNSEFRDALDLPNIPEGCFSPPGITSISGIDVSSSSEIFQKVFVIGLGGALLRIECGGASVVSFPVLQIYLDDEWRRFVNPTDDVTNAFLEENLSLLIEMNDRLKIELQRSERGGLDFVNYGPLSVGVRSINGVPHILYYMRFSGDGERDQVFDILSVIGCNVRKANDRENGDPTILIDGGIVDPSAILGDARGILGVTNYLHIVNLRVNEYNLENAQSRFRNEGVIVFSAEEIARELERNTCNRTRHWLN